MSKKTVYLVTGSNRGIGFGVVSTLAARPNAIVFAGARDPDSAQSLKDLAAARSNVHPIKFVVNDQENNEAAIAEIKKTAGQLDVIIANAAISKEIGPVVTASLSSFKEHWEVNTLGLVVLFQAAHALLLASPTGAPVLAYISTYAASISDYQNYTAAAYGASKAAGNFIIKALDAEHPALIACAIAPGWVATDMGNRGAEMSGMGTAPVSVQESVDGILSRIDSATKKKTSGKFWNFKPQSGGNFWEFDAEELKW